MIYRFFADAVLALHALFVAFAAAGGLAVWWRPRLAWLHLPAVAWGAWIMLAGRTCPLTPLENALRSAAGQEGYRGGFIEHYVTAVIYPEGLARSVQVGLGVALVLGNACAYALALRRRRRSASQSGRR